MRREIDASMLTHHALAGVRHHMRAITTRSAQQVSVAMLALSAASAIALQATTCSARSRDAHSRHTAPAARQINGAIVRAVISTASPASRQFCSRPK